MMALFSDTFALALTSVLPSVDNFLLLVLQYTYVHNHNWSYHKLVNKSFVNTKKNALTVTVHVCLFPTNNVLVHIGNALTKS